MYLHILSSASLDVNRESPAIALLEKGDKQNLDATVSYGHRASGNIAVAVLTGDRAADLARIRTGSGDGLQVGAK
jgi:hypothetical protein